MTWGLLILIIITAYLAGAAMAAPRLMRLIYEERLAAQVEDRARHEKALAEWRKKGGGYKPRFFDRRTKADLMHYARYEGFWWSLLWPFALAYWHFGATAFKQEIAAAQAEKNAQIIADYDRLLHERFDQELSIPTKSGPLRIHRFLKEKL